MAPVEKTATSTLPPLRGDGIPFFNHFLKFRADPLQFWLTSGQMAPLTRIRLGPVFEYWVVTDPDLLQRILQKRAKQYPREGRLSRLNRMDGPELLFNTLDWQEWLWRRRLMQPAFHRQQIARFGEEMVRETERLLESWHVGQTFDLEHMMKTLTMRIIGRTMFSVDVQSDTDMLQQSFELSSQFSYKRASSMFTVPLWLPTPTNLQAKEAVRQRLAILKRIVEGRYALDEPQDDLLDMLIVAHLEGSDRQFTAEQLVYEMGGIVFAGHETTALTLTWLFYLLDQHPAVEAKLRREIESVLQGNAPTIADLPHLPYTEQVVLETLRLYPPVYVTIREAAERDHWQGYDIPRGSSLLLNIRGMHRSPHYWQNPERFEPERFAPERSQKRHKFAFIPFISGPRKCIGDSFAMMEMQLVVPTILQRYQLRYSGTQPPVAAPSFVMKPKAGMPMCVAQLDQIYTGT